MLACMVMPQHVQHVLAHHGAAASAGRYDIIIRFEYFYPALAQFLSLIVEPIVEKGLTAAGLRLRKMHHAPEVFEYLGHRDANPRIKLVSQAGNEQGHVLRFFHALILTCCVARPYSILTSAPTQGTDAFRLGRRASITTTMVRPMVLDSQARASSLEQLCLLPPRCDTARETAKRPDPRVRRFALHALRQLHSHSPGPRQIVSGATILRRARYRRAPAPRRQRHLRHRASVRCGDLLLGLPGSRRIRSD